MEPPAVKLISFSLKIPSVAKFSTFILDIARDAYLSVKKGFTAVKKRGNDGAIHGHAHYRRRPCQSSVTKQP